MIFRERRTLLAHIRVIFVIPRILGLFSNARPPATTIPIRLRRPNYSVWKGALPRGLRLRFFQQQELSSCTVTSPKSTIMNHPACSFREQCLHTCRLDASFHRMCSASHSQDSKCGVKCDDGSECVGYLSPP